MSDRTRTAIVSFLLIFGYLGFGYLLLTGWIKPNVSGDVALTLTGGVFGVLTAGFCWALGYELGSSAGSRSKDAIIAGQIPPPATTAPSSHVGVPPPKPQPPPVTPKPDPGPPTSRMTGIMATVFSEAEPDNAQVAYPDVAHGWSNRPSVALPFHFHGARPRVQVWGPKGSAVCEIVDVGPWYDGRTGWPADPYWQTGARPHAEGDSRTNGAAIDLSPAAASAVGISGKGKVDWAFVDAAIISVPSNERTKSDEPPWLTFARAEIGFHELPDNHGIQRYVDLAGYGADGEPWCSIFAGAMLRKAGIDITGANAMARSFSTAPSFTKINAPRMGAIAVYWRGSRDGDQGHVGFYVGEDATHVQTLGGNENDQVEIEPIPKSGSTMGLLGYYWPVSAAAEPKLS